MSNWEILWSSREVFWQGFNNTLTIFLISSVLAFTLGCMLLFLMEGSKSRKIPISVFIDSMRMLPFLILAYILYYGLPAVDIRLTAWQAGILALVIYHGAYFAEILRGSRVTLSNGQQEACMAIGLSKIKMFTRIILPQLILRTRGVLGNQLIILLKDSAFLIIITVQELTASANILSSTYFIPMEAFIVVIGFYWLISLALEQLIRFLGRVGEKRGFNNA